MRSLLAVERADVCVIMIDATRGRHRAGHQGRRRSRTNAGKACIIVVNKWDLVEKDGSHHEGIYATTLREGLAYMPYAPVLFISAQTGQRVDELFALIHEVYEQNAYAHPDRPPERHSGRGDGARTAAYRQGPPPEASIYMTQASTCPPTLRLLLQRRTACSTSRTSAIWKTRSARYSA